MSERVCKQCGISIKQKNRRAMFCGKECRELYYTEQRRAHIEEKSCIICGTMFMPRSTRVVCCSTKCTAEHHKEAAKKLRAKKGHACDVDAKQSMQSDVGAKKRACMVCDEYFVPRNPLHVICSEACKARHKVWMKARLEAELYRERLMQSAALVGEDYG